MIFNPMETVQRKLRQALRNYQIIAIIFGVTSSILVVALYTIFLTSEIQSYQNLSYPITHLNFTINDVTARRKPLTGNENILIKTFSSQLDFSLCQYQNNNCYIQCSDGTIEEVIDELNYMMEYDVCDSQIKLSLSNIIFPTSNISYGWLNALKAVITELKITNCNLEYFGTKTFSGAPFLGTSLDLILSETNIKLLNKETFMGSTLNSISIEFYELNHGILFGRDVFLYTAKFLHTIALRRCLTNSRTLRNITGATSAFTELQTMDLRDNQLTKLEANTFRNVPKLLSIYLSYCSVNSIDVGAFKALDNVKNLDLSNNNLITLQEAVLDDLSRNVELVLQENPWQCTCDLMWLKFYLLERATSLWPNCKIGSFWKPMRFVEFCPNNYTTIPSTSTITPDMNLYRNIACQNASKISLLMEQPKMVLLQTATFKRRNIDYSIYHIEADRYAVELIGMLLSMDFLIWTNVNDREDYGCMYNVLGKIEVNLQSGSTYTFCLATNDTSDTAGTIVSNDCTATSTVQNETRSIWLYSDQKLFVLSLAISTIVGIILISCGATYCTIKHYPRLLSVLTNRNSDNCTRSSSLKEQSASSLIKVTLPNYNVDDVQSFQTNPEGYLTPKLKRWFGSFRHRKLDVVSENGEETVDEKYCKIYEPPPPLPPPNHPLMERRNSARPYFHSNM